MSVLYPGQVTAQQSSALFNIALRHAFLQSVVSDGLADVHKGRSNIEKSDGVGLHSNQSSTVWQVEIGSAQNPFRVISLSLVAEAS